MCIKVTRVTSRFAGVPAPEVGPQPLPWGADRQRAEASLTQEPRVLPRPWGEGDSPSLPGKFPSKEGGKRHPGAFPGSSLPGLDHRIDIYKPM